MDVGLTGFGSTRKAWDASDDRRGFFEGSSYGPLLEDGLTTYAGLTSTLNSSAVAPMLA